MARLQIYFEEFRSRSLPGNEKISIMKARYAYRKSMQLPALPGKGNDILLKIKGKKYQAKVYSSAEEMEDGQPVVKVQSPQFIESVNKKIPALISLLESDGWILWKKQEYTEKEMEAEYSNALGYCESGVPTRTRE